MSDVGRAWASDSAVSQRRLAVRIPLMASAMFALLSVGAGLVQAAPILVNMDFDGQGSGDPAPVTHGGVGAIGNAGDIWNGLAAPSGSTSYSIDNMVDSDGNATTVDFVINGVLVTDHMAANDDSHALMYDYALALKAGEMPFTISGLTADQPYDLYMFGGNGNQSSRTVIFTIDGVSQVTHPAHGAAATPINSEDYVLFSGLLADGSNQISGIIDTGDASSIFNGLQLLATDDPPAVPEPSTVVLLACVVPIAWMRRGKSRKR